MDSANNPARALGIHASRVRRDVVVSSEETGGFKYVPGGRECASFADSEE